MKKGENCKICSHKINFLGLFSENHSLIGSFSYREFLLHKKFGRAIFFSYREFSLTRSSLIGSFDCTQGVWIDGYIATKSFHLGPQSTKIARCDRVSFGNLGKI